MHKKIFSSVFVLLVGFSNLLAQTLTVNSSQLIFGSISETVADSQLIIISNPLGKSVDVTGVRFYNVYGKKAFSVRDSVFTIAAGGTKSIYVKFLPQHNVAHNTEMIILNNSGGGNVRIDLLGQGRYSKTYYNASQNLAEEDLKLALQTITGTNYVSLGYSSARDQMYMLIDNKATNGQGAGANTLECVYTARLAVGYVSRSDCQTNYNFNTEHTWPQSMFSSQEPMLSDLHHLYPTDEAANTARASYPFGVVTGTPSWSVGGSKYGGGKFEPRDASKGQIARTMLYFAMRYQNYSSFLNTQEAVLRTWVQMYPPTAIDIKRNNDIFSFQNNRNPFIDYPQLLDRITNMSGTSFAPQTFALDLTESLINFGNIPVSQLKNYGHILVNTGNQPISISAVSVSGAGFALQGGTFPNTTLAPGEALRIPVTANIASAGSHAGTLSYQSNASGQANVSIPIQANVITTGIASVDRSNSVEIYPNPAIDLVQICFHSESDHASAYSYSITDLQGRMMKSVEKAYTSDCISFSCSELASGYYNVRLESEEGKIFHSRLVVVRP